MKHLVIFCFATFINSSKDFKTVTLVTTKELLIPTKNSTRFEIVNFNAFAKISESKTSLKDPSWHRP